ncbi:hypothetical protein L6452_01068 [Arctium lappa]|uniref:Uncharacterized protein n=1 Tax=Arctium lappa TaxID=4217 RepID=A0ACB9FFL8_ARCLA|nr:hypothetical protein L6452_01068 [Arctium lappa]
MSTACIQDLQATVAQLVNKGKLPSQTKTNSKTNVNAITLSSGKELQDSVNKKKEDKIHDEEEELEVKASNSGEKDVKDEETNKKAPKVIVQAPPFPGRFEWTKREREEKEILDTLRKVKVNIPLLDVIKQVPRYAKFLKELCTNKRKLKGKEKISMSQNVSAVLQKRLPPKCNDLGMFTIPCKVGNVSVNQAMLDLGASINVMPYAIYSSLDVVPLKPTSMTKIDVHDGNLTMEFDGEMKSLSDTIYDLSNYDVLEVILDRDLTNGSFKKLAQEYKLNDDFAELVSWMERGRAPKPRYEVSKIDLPLYHTRLLPSIEQAPELELKTLPDHLKYTYLGVKETIPVIISSTLSPKKEGELVGVLKEHKRAIGFRVQAITRDARLNVRKTMVKKEILKLLDADMIYPICDNKWVHPIQVVPKKTSITVVKNAEGHVITERGIEVDMAKVDVIRSLPHPTSIREDTLTSAPIIRPPNWQLPFEFISDASNHAVVAKLGQKDGKNSHVIYYASRSLDNAQSNYSTTEKELQAVVFALEKFRSYLLGTKVTVFSNHATLKYLLKKRDAKTRLIRWILLLQEFNMEIRDENGAENLVEDHLSRLALDRRQSPLIDEFPDEHLFSISEEHPWFGTPKAIISDRGTHFWKKRSLSLFSRSTGLSTTSIQSNGQAEVSNREIKSILEKTVELDHKTYWAVKTCNMYLDEAESHRKLQIQELEEIRNDSYENAHIYKAKAKAFHDSCISLEIQSLSTGQIFKVNGHRLKPFYEGVDGGYLERVALDMPSYTD